MPPRPAFLPGAAESTCTVISDTAVHDLPPSANLVYKVLDYRGSQTQKQIAERSMLSTRTVRYALDRLDDVGVLESEVHIPDARQKMYSLQHDA